MSKTSSRKSPSRKSSSRKSSSRKSSSRKSSSRKSPSSNSLCKTSASKELYTDTTYSVNIKQRPSPIYSYIFTLIINGIILYYLINLEDATCNCITDWRHNYIKYFSIFMIILNTFMYFSINIPGFKTSSVMKTITSVFLVLSLLNMYALYTYIGDLNDTKCACAVDKQKNINTFLYYYRYMFIILPIIFILGFIMLLFIIMR